MNGPVDVLARYEAECVRALTRLRGLIQDGVLSQYEKELADLTQWHREAVEARAAVAELIERDERSERIIEALRDERDHARECRERAVQVLAGIHALLYPPKHTNAVGVTFKFHSPYVHEQMQALSDRIRAIPGEMFNIRSGS